MGAYFAFILPKTLGYDVKIPPPPSPSSKCFRAKDKNKNMGKIITIIIDKSEREPNMEPPNRLHRAAHEPVVHPGNEQKT